jgi:hypothetical protein
MSDDGKAEMVGGSATTELASSRTGLALERSMMGADRTLMAKPCSPWASCCW